MLDHIAQPEDAAVTRPAPGRIRVALAQRTSVLGTETHDPRDQNLERGIVAVREAAAAGAQLIVFGELYLTGYRTDEWLHKWATTVDPPDQHVLALVNVARELGVHLIMGTATFGRFMPGDVYNSAVLVGPDGVIGTYRKSHVGAFPYGAGIAMERCFYSPGQDLPVFDTSIGRLGIHICYDMSFPEVSRVQTLLGAELLINVSASAGGFEETWIHGTYMRAVENASWYMVCSVVGVQRGDRLFGGSRVVDPSGRVVAQGKYDEEDLVLADIDVSLAHAARAKGHLFSTRNPLLYGPVTEPVARP